MPRGGEVSFFQRDLSEGGQQGRLHSRLAFVAGYAQAFACVVYCARIAKQVQVVTEVI